MNIVDSHTAMPRTDNMAVFNDPMQLAYGRLHSPQFISYPEGRQAAWSSYPELSGIYCNIGAPLGDHHSSPYLAVGHPSEVLESHTEADSSAYPSPPSTSSDPKRSVPLPNLSSNGEPMLFHQPSRYFGGVLDSPLVMRHEALKAQAPLSPPPTLPTTTQALPPTDNELLSEYEQNHSESSCLTDSFPCTPNIQGVVEKQLLSPLSPEWESNKISDIQSPSPSQASVLMHEHISAPSGSSYHRASSADGPSCRPTLSFLDIPGPFYSPDNHWDDPVSPEMMDTDYQGFLGSPPVSPPSSPRPQSRDIDLEMAYDDCSTDDQQYFLHPSLPLIYNHSYLPDLDDPFPADSPSSPSLRSFSSLPQLELHEDDMAFSPPPSQLLSLPGADTDDDLLPADLAPQSFIPDPHTVPPPSSGRSLLLLDDPNDVPPPRSPSPENFDLDPAMLAEHPDPDLMRLYELRKRSQAAERSARQLEAVKLEQGSVSGRAEARKMRKLEKERSREISALLRLKLGEKAASGGEDERRQQVKSSKRAITSIPQLVARMTFRRRDTFRPLANRKTPWAPDGYRRSPLFQSITAASLDSGDLLDTRSSRTPPWFMLVGQLESDRSPISYHWP